MLIRTLGGAAVLALVAVGAGAPAAAQDGLRGHDVPTAWSRMSRSKMMSRRKMMTRKSGGTASGSAPNGRNFGMGPTGQPSGVK